MKPKQPPMKQSVVGKTPETACPTERERESEVSDTEDDKPDKRP